MATIRGYTRDPEHSSDGPPTRAAELMEVPLKVTIPRLCERVLHRLRPEHFCCVPIQVLPASTCRGDSGGPGIDEQGIVTGFAVVERQHCGQARAPSAFIKLRPLMDWIYDEVPETRPSPPKNGDTVFRLDMSHNGRINAGTRPGS